MRNRYIASTSVATPLGTSGRARVTDVTSAPRNVRTRSCWAGSADAWSTGGAGAAGAGAGGGGAGGGGGGGAGATAGVS